MVNRPKCFNKCECGDMKHEHCINRLFPVPKKCVDCRFYFGFLEKLKPIPDYGDLFTLEDFIKDCKDGCFIDYDGHGRYALEDGMTEILVCPSDIKRGDIKGEYTHVVWFNR